MRIFSIFVVFVNKCLTESLYVTYHCAIHLYNIFTHCHYHRVITCAPVFSMGVDPSSLVIDTNICHMF